MPRWQEERAAALADYFTRLGVAYSGDGYREHALIGTYRGVTLGVHGEQLDDGKEISGEDADRNTFYRRIYRNYLRVGIQLNPPVQPQVAVIHRNEYALLSKRGGFPVVNGNVLLLNGKYTVGQDLLHSQYVAVNRLLEVGIPEFDAEFGVICPNEQHARNVLSPELARWITGDHRSRGTRIKFEQEWAYVYFRTAGVPEPPELFAPEWIFPAADYLIDLLGHAPADVVRPAPPGQPGHHG